MLTWHVDRYNTNDHYVAVAVKNNNNAVDRQGNDRLLVKQSLGEKTGIKDDEGRTTNCRDVSRILAVAHCGKCLSYAVSSTVEGVYQVRKWVQHATIQ
jgi:hypothetical protein